MSAEEGAPATTYCWRAGAPREAHVGLEAGLMGSPHPSGPSLPALVYGGSGNCLPFVSAFPWGARGPMNNPPLSDTSVVPNGPCTPAPPPQFTSLPPCF